MKRKLDLQLDITKDYISELVFELAGDKQPEAHSFIRQVRSLLNKLPGVAEMIKFDDAELKVVWIPDGGIVPIQSLIGMLEKGQYLQAAFLMEVFLTCEDDNPSLLYNLGMAYSDMGKLDRAQLLLQKLLEVEPGNVNGRVAYGVALMRNRDYLSAEEQLRIAVDQEPSNPWAHRNLGGALLNMQRPADAVPYLQKAAEYNPQDERAWYGLGQALELVGDLAKADEAYINALELNEFGDLAEQIRKSRSRLAEKSFRSASPGGERMDAAMYCLDALEMFETMDPSKIQNIGFEIAILGTRGIDINDPEKKYTLKSLPGNFSGLHLVCIEYAAFKEIAPEQDIGIDLASEYHMAIELFNLRKSKEDG